MKNTLLIFEGPDMCGKTNISQAFCRRTGVPYFKRSNETASFADKRDNGQEYFKNALVHGGSFLADFILQTRASAVLDRCYPSERVYSKFFGRPTIADVHEELDRVYSVAGAKLVLCLRESYAGVYDDARPDLLNPTALQTIHNLYLEVAEWTRLPVLQLYVDDRDLERQVREVMAFAFDGVNR